MLHANETPGASIWSVCVCVCVCASQLMRISSLLSPCTETDSLLVSASPVENDAVRAIDLALKALYEFSSCSVHVQHTLLAILTLSAPLTPSQYSAV